MREKEFGPYLPLSPIILDTVCLISELNKQTAYTSSKWTQLLPKEGKCWESQDNRHADLPAEQNALTRDQFNK